MFKPDSYLKYATRQHKQPPWNNLSNKDYETDGMCKQSEVITRRKSRSHCDGNVGKVKEVKNNIERGKLIKNKPFSESEFIFKPT